MKKSKDKASGGWRAYAQPPLDEKQQPSLSEKQQPPLSEKQQPPDDEKQQPSDDEKQHPFVVEKQHPPVSEKQQPGSYDGSSVLLRTPVECLQVRDPSLDVLLMGSDDL
ncbi:hypothetical protein HMPREF1624_05159 [Sporothrix schenckii ATCC 58251]|uniref:Uncharacterized protein n=1 Tax=Sporothrix schenckii (strain ATCC 58251 / de Perez 2211183) TaxID=1391915 RepID=U7PVA8_SPOS1|nr:hypothetical protein HMPREF1624_05159 [Sporothrix schenckii ATCC 58251]